MVFALNQASFDWLSLIDKRFEQQVGVASTLGCGFYTDMCLI